MCWQRHTQNRPAFHFPVFVCFQSANSIKHTMLPWRKLIHVWKLFPLIGCSNPLRTSKTITMTTGVTQTFLCKPYSCLPLDQSASRACTCSLHTHAMGLSDSLVFSLGEGETEQQTAASGAEWTSTPSREQLHLCLGPMTSTPHHKPLGSAWGDSAVRTGIPPPPIPIWETNTGPV